jgi:hypothetical protein
VSMLLLLTIISWIYTFNQTKVYIDTLKQFADWLSKPDFVYTPLNLSGLFLAIVGSIQILLLGIVATRCILPDLKDRLQVTLLTVAMGSGFTGLIVILLSYLKILYFHVALLAIWLLVMCFVYYKFPKKDYKLLYSKDYIYRLYQLIFCWLVFYKLVLYQLIYKFRITKFRIIKFEWMSKFDWLWIEIILVGTIFIAIYYHAGMFPPLEVDAIIYHAPLASIIFKEHGLPFIAGGGVGIGLSANYPFLFSALGTYYYLWMGSIQDLFLRIITPTMGLLSVVATYCIGKEIDGKRTGMIAAFLFSVVPSFLSYSSLSTQETTIIFFLATCVLFLIKAVDNGINNYWIVSGILFGFALLTSYQALYFIPALVILLVYYCVKSNDTKSDNKTISINCKHSLMMIFSMLAIGGAPYIRNLIVVHNPVYPFFNQFFDSEFISPWMYEYTKRSLNYVASYIVTGSDTASNFDFISSTLVYPSFYPLNALLTFPAMLTLLFSNVRMKNVILIFALIPSLLIILNKPSFIRYLWLTIPYSAVMVGWTFSKGFDLCDKLRYDLFARFIKLSLSLMIIAMLVFALPMIIGGSAYVFIVPMWSKLDTHEDYLWYTKNPNMDKQLLLDRYYGDDAYAWNFLNNNMGNNDKVATFETRIYYIKNSNYNAIFSLDNKESERLYNIYDINKTISFMKQNRIKFFFERNNEEEKEMFNRLPLTKFLGSSYFPIIYEKGGSRIYNIGPLSNNDTKESMTFILPGNESSSSLSSSDTERDAYKIQFGDDNGSIILDSKATWK